MSSNVEIKIYNKVGAPIFDWSPDASKEKSRNILSSQYSVPVLFLKFDEEKTCNNKRKYMTWHDIKHYD